MTRNRNRHSCRHGGAELDTGVEEQRNGHLLVLAVPLQPDDDVADDAEIGHARRQCRVGDAPVQHEDEKDVEHDIATVDVMSPIITWRMVPSAPDEASPQPRSSSDQVRPN